MPPLRAAPPRCNVTDEPKRFMVFTRQRSGSRWFVDTISALGDGHRFVEPHIRELSLNGTPFHTQVTVDGAPDAAAHWSEIMVQLGLWAAPDLERVRNRGATGPRRWKRWITKT